jgi:hypothetical protein
MREHAVSASPSDRSRKLGDILRSDDVILKRKIARMGELDRARDQAEHPVQRRALDVELIELGNELSRTIRGMKKAVQR